MAEALFYEVLNHLKGICPTFGLEHKSQGVPKRFKRMIHIVDSTTIQLILNCMDWAKHRRRKAAAKCHVRLDLQTFLPSFALVKEASAHTTTILSDEEVKLVNEGGQEDYPETFRLVKALVEVDGEKR